MKKVNGFNWGTLVFLSVLVGGCGGSPSTITETDSGPPTDLDAGSDANFTPGDAGNKETCEPKTCEELGANCGPVADGCGGILECGKCDDGHICGLFKANTCTTDEQLSDLCQPISKEEACAGKECGVEGNGCGGTYDCGSCEDGEACGYEVAFQCAPVVTGSDDDCPTRIESCASVGAECGVIGNGCGGTIDCTEELGGCTAGTFCGLGGPQQCGSLPTCEPLTPEVACAGKCGLVSNGCGAEVDGGVIDCTAYSPCPTGEACGAGGIPNQCGSATGTCDPLTQAEACGSLECGSASDGCDSSYNCGTCSGGEVCKAGTCEAPSCSPMSKEDACGTNECGTVGDGCGGTYDCGTCGPDEQCGGQVAFQCDPIIPPDCVAMTQQEACAGKECGIVYDGCGTAPENTYDCGSCSEGEFCGLEQAFQCDAPDIPECTPTATSCAELGWECGQAINNCGDIYSCEDEGRTCAANETCMGGTDGPTECISGGEECEICPGIPDCDGEDQLTRLTGRVVTPGRTDGDASNQIGVPNAFVYILRTNDENDLPAITSGIPSGGTSCDRCDDQDLGAVLASATTDATGSYMIEGNIPVDEEFLLVVKAGKFRRAVHYTLPAAAACETTNLPTSLPANPTRLPRSMSDGLAVNIPRVAVATGSIDAMECVLEKMGIAHSQFTRPQQGGPIHLYRANGAWPDQTSENCDDCDDSGCRATWCGGSNWSDRNNFLDQVSDGSLLEDGGRINEYDMVILACEGGGWDNDMDDRDAWGDNVREYVNRGGRMFASHLSFTWLYNNGTAAYDPDAPFATGLGNAATWTTSVDSSSNTGTGVISVGRTNASPRIDNFKDWMINEGISTSTPPYEFEIDEPRSQNTGLGTFSEEFVYRDGGPATNRVQQFSFNTPYGAPEEAACGRVAYSGFHVSIGSTGNSVFPDHCSGSLTDQEKVLLYALFDLGACVGSEPEPPSCTKRECPTDGSCGIQGDGCGGTLDCGCGAAEACVEGQCIPQDCVPTTCEAEGVVCSSISDGCGQVLECACPECDPITQQEACAGVTCGYASDGCSDVYFCSECPPDCEPLTECPAGLDCGIISDGCSDTLNCGTCGLPEVCGGGGTPNVCDVPECQPLSCADFGASCGMVGDGCGGSVDCGQCPQGQVCGVVNGVPNQCTGCEPRTCEDAGAECGLIGDGCGGTIECGTCDNGKICGAEAPNQCGDGPSCTPATCKSAGAECGIIGDGCGDQVNCGACPTGQVCGIDTPFQCGDPPACTPTTCEAAGAECGPIGDGCGELIQCGECPEGFTCGLSEPNQCDRVVIR